MFDQPPPFDLEAERQLCAAVLVGLDVLPRIAAIVQPADFYGTREAAIYAACLACHDRGESVDTLTVGNELARRGQAESVADYRDLSDLTTDLPTTIGVEHWARLVADCAAYRRLHSAGIAIAELGLYAGHGQPVEATLADALARLRGVRAGRSDAAWETVAAVIEREYAGILDRLTNPSARRGISTLWPSVDRLLYGGGLLPGWLYTWLAQTSIGKSTTGRTMLRNVALSGEHCALFTLEQSRAVSAEQILFGLAGIDGHYHESNGVPVSVQQLAALEHARNRVRDCLDKLHVRDDAGITPSTVRLALEELAATHPVKVVVIDYLHRMRPDRQGRRDSEAADFGAIATALSDTARELNLAIVLFAQVNRKNLARGTSTDEASFKPTLGDLKWSGDVENVSNCILSLHRRQWYVERGFLPEKPGTEQDIEIAVLKQQIGPAGVAAALHFDGARATVEDRDGWYREAMEDAG